MSQLACPKCRLALTDATLDAGECPCCGYDGPMVLATSGKWAWLVATAAVVLGGATLGGYLLVPRSGAPAPGPEAASVAPLALSGSHTRQSGPIDPAAPKPPNNGEAPTPKAEPKPEPPQPDPHKPEPPKPEPGPVPPKPNPWIIAPPPKHEPPPKPVAPVEPGPIIRIDPKEVREKKIDNPRATVLVPDMTREERLTLTGKVRRLQIGSVGGKAVLEASGLEAEEIVVTGDLGGTTVVKLNAPNGTVTIGGHVTGSAKLTVSAPGGRVTVAAKSGKLAGGAEATVTAKLVEMKGTLAGNARLRVTLTDGGAYKLTGAMEDKATAVIN